MAAIRLLARIAMALVATVGSNANAAESGWWDYRIIMWQDHTAIENAALRALGVTTAMVMADRSGEHPEAVAAQIAPVRAAGFGWFIENIATDFYSPYHRWSGERPVNWRFLEAKARHHARPDDRAPFVRDPSLSDPEWLATIRARLAAIVATQRADAPLYYDLADEPGIGDLAAAWDFDFSAPSLAAMRIWLREQYGDLVALNREWGTRFASWDQVTPMTTDEALRGGDDNFAAWADFKAWMDVAFARAVRAGTDAVHQADPHAIAGIEGAQIPGWGGYDYTRLVDSVDLMEPYDYGDNVEIIHALKPDMILITTSYKRGPAEAQRIWRELLRGNRGLLLWDDKGEFVRPDGAWGARAHEVSALFAELRGGLGALLINSRPLRDPVAILYSPSSERTQWLLDRRADGGNWAERAAEVEYEDNAIRLARRSTLSTLEHTGLKPRILSPAQLEQGALVRDGDRVLVLTGAIALSDAEIDAIHDFTAHGGALLADTTPGLFDQHSCRRATPQSIERRDGPLLDAVKAAGIVAPLTVEHADGRPADDVEIHRFQNGDVTILALLRDAPADSATETVTIHLARPAYIAELRNGASHGRRGDVTVVLHATAPAILALSDQPPPALAIELPSHLRAGATATFGIGAPRPADARPVFHVEAVDPYGNVSAAHSGNLLAPGGRAETALRFAPDDPTGRWTFHVTDRLSGGTATARLVVEPR